MPSNLELKARITSVRRATRNALTLGARRREVLMQKDTYYSSPRGRLKLREINRRQYEIIYYHRQNIQGNRFSEYQVIPVQKPVDVKKFLGDMLGILCVVQKRRTLFLYKNARIHLDVVRGLGTFLEFEVLVTNGKRQARALMKELWKAFDIQKEAVVAGSYSDFIQRDSGRKNL